mgnify:CR=1 FL=1
MEMEEQILAEGCREGEDTARRELYDRYAARLLAVCLRYSGDRATAEDLMHDAFLKIYGAFDRFSYRGPGSLRAWIERIAVNVALEWLRNRNKLNFRTLDEGRALPDVPEPDPSEVARIPRDVLMEFVGELPDGPYGVQPLLHRGVFAPRYRADAGDQRKKFLVAVVPGADAAGPQDCGVYGDTLDYETK